MKRICVLAELLLACVGVALSDFPETLVVTGITTPDGANGTYDRLWSVELGYFYYGPSDVGGTNYLIFWHDGDLPTDPVSDGWGWRVSTVSTYIFLATGGSADALPADGAWVAEAGYDVGTIDYETAVVTGVRIQQRYTAGESNLYAIVMRNTDTYVWDVAAGAFAAAPTWTDCDIALAEHALIAGLYTGPFPATAYGDYSVFVYQGASPASSDTYVGGSKMAWDGNDELQEGDVVRWHGEYLSGDITTDTYHAEILELFGGTRATVGEFDAYPGSATLSVFEISSVSVGTAAADDDRFDGYTILNPANGETHTILDWQYTAGQGFFAFVPKAASVAEEGDVLLIIPKYSVLEFLATMLQETYSGSGDYEFDSPAVRRAKGSRPY